MSGILCSFLQSFGLNSAFIFKILLNFDLFLFKSRRHRGACEKPLPFLILNFEINKKLYNILGLYCFGPICTWAFICGFGYVPCSINIKTS